METLTIREAAERCEVSYQLMRKRVDRGTIPTVKRDGVRLVPRVELERAGLWPGSQPQLSDSTELVSLRAENERQAAEIKWQAAELDAERQARERAEQAAYAARAGEQTTAAQLAAIEAQAAEHAELVSRLATGSLVERWRARREIRDGSSAPATTTPAAV